MDKKEIEEKKDHEQANKEKPIEKKESETVPVKKEVELKKWNDVTFKDVFTPFDKTAP